MDPHKIKKSFSGGSAVKVIRMNDCRNIILHPHPEPLYCFITLSHNRTASRGRVQSVSIPTHEATAVTMSEKEHTILKLEKMNEEDGI